jgi:hypothetical protein
LTTSRALSMRSVRSVRLESAYAEAAKIATHKKAKNLFIPHPFLENLSIPYALFRRGFQQLSGPPFRTLVALDL